MKREKPAPELTPEPHAEAPAPFGAGEVRHLLRWDLDKTYLSTDFDSVVSLVKIAFESAEKKVNVPGAAPLLRHLTAPEERGGDVHVYFISGSPRQLRRVIEKKLEIDGIGYRHLHLKPNLENLARGRFRAIKEQVGYKLPLLLRGRLPYLPEVSETLFGDDAESDAYIYSLYADYMAGDVPWEIVEQVLLACGVYADTLERTAEAHSKLLLGDCVERIYINLDRRSRLDRFAALSPRIVPVYNYWQAALCLAEQGRIGPEGVAEVGATLLERYAYTPPRLRNSTEDLIRRGLLTPDALGALVASLAELGEGVAPLVAGLKRLSLAPPPPLTAGDGGRDGQEGEPRDYLKLLALDKEARHAAKAAQQATRRARAAQEGD